jgi:hypothetical protein
MSAEYTGSTSRRKRHQVAQLLKRWLDKPAGERSRSDVRELAKPSNEALTRFKSIPLLFQTPSHVPLRTCPIVYDSSAGGPLIGLRNATDGHIRRVRFAVGGLELEVVAERRDKAWEFVARVYQEGDVAHRFVLRAGARKLMADAAGFFHWTSESVPHRFQLFSFEEKIACEVVPW